MNELDLLRDLARRINQEHDSAKAAFTRGFEHALRAGELLLEAKAKVKHGEWLPWLKANCSISQRTAQLYMRVVRERPQLEAKNASLADLTLEDAAKQLATPCKFDRRASWAEVINEACAEAVRHLDMTINHLEAYRMVCAHLGDESRFDADVRAWLHDAFDPENFAYELFGSPTNADSLMSGMAKLRDEFLSGAR
jgi:hypothetical protein